MLRGIEDGWFQGAIADSAYDLERSLTLGRRTVVGVNRFTDGDDEVPALLSIGAETDALQRKRLDAVKQARDDDTVARALGALTTDAQSGANVMPALIRASKARTTAGEMVTALENVFGTWVETPRV